MQKHPTVTLVGRVFLVIIATAVSPGSTANAAMGVASPDGRILVSVTDTQGLQYAVSVDGDPIVVPSSLGLAFNGDVSFGPRAKIVGATEREVNEPWENRFGPEKQVANHYKEATFRLQESDRYFGLIVRAY